jgi:meckelin
MMVRLVANGWGKLIWFSDPDYKFTSLYLMGIEYDIVTFLVALYAICDLVFGSIFVSIVVIFVANRTLSFIRQHWGQINISKKTLVDERFLI